MWKRQDFKINTERCYLRLPQLQDYEIWVNLRRKSEDFLSEWEPSRDRDFYSLSAFKLRVKWANKQFSEKKVIHAFIFRQEDGILIGAITLTFRKRENIKRQNYFDQISREKSTSIELKDVEFNKGVKLDD